MGDVFGKEFFMMEKRKYFVSVGSGEIHEDPNVAAYQFEIEATPAEAGQLRRLFEEANGASGSSFLKMRSLEREKHHPYDQVLSSIYQTIHDLGDGPTQDHIASMNVLQ